MFKKEKKKIVHIPVNIVRLLLRSQDLTESFSEVPANVEDIFPQRIN